MSPRFRRRKFLGFVVLASGLLTSGAIVSCRSPRSAPRVANESIVYSREVPPTPVDVILLIDESGSMRGEQGTDNAGLRYEASKYLLQSLLVKKSDPARPHRIAVVHFGSEARTGTLLPVTIGGALQVQQSIPLAGPHLGNTNFAAALEEAARIAESAADAAGRRKIAVLFTDGEPDDRRKLTLDQYFGEIRQVLGQRLKGWSVNVIGVDNASSPVKFSETVPRWRELVGAEHVVALRQVRDLYTEFNAVLQRIFELPAVEPVALSGRQEFDVTPYLSRLEFHVFSDSSIRVGIRRPNGTLVKAGEKGTTAQEGPDYRILTVDEPTPGMWSYEILEGSGSVRVLRNPVPFRMRLVHPSRVSAAGNTVLLRAVFTREGGDDVRELPDYPLSFTAKIEGPEGTGFEEDVRFPADRKVGGMFYADRAITLPKAGEYSVRLRVKGGTRVDTSSTEPLFVQSLPYVVVESLLPLGTVALSDSVNLDVSLQRDGRPTDPQKEFRDNPNDLILAQIVASPGGARSPSVWLSHLGGGRFRATIPFSIVSRGTYGLAVRLRGEPRIPDLLSPRESVEYLDFYAAPTLWQRIIDVAAWGGLAAIILLGAWGVILLVWLLKCPKYVGQLTLTIGGEERLAGYFQALRFRTPKRYSIERKTLADAEGENNNGGKPIKVWVWMRARGGESLCVYRGGWVSFLTFGLRSEKAVAVQGDDERAELAEDISVQVGA